MIMTDIDGCIRKLKTLTEEHKIVWEITDTDPHTISTKVNGDVFILDNKGLSVSFTDHIFDSSPFMLDFIDYIVRMKTDRRYYNKWMREITLGKSPSDLINKCKEFSILMVRDFPELRLVGGYYICSKLGKRVHWWCETPNGVIIDPTAAQFPSRGTGSYREVLPRERENGRRCKTCMSPLYDDEINYCTIGCESRDKSYNDYLKRR